MFLDRPGRFFYRHRFNLYGPMRVFCTDYRYFVCGAVAAIAALLSWLLARPSVLEYLGIR